MFTTIAKTFTFDAAHHLPTMPEGHKCRRPHGHTYEVMIVLRGKVDKATGILIDYADIGRACDKLHDLLDHRNLNDIPGLEIPTTEVLVAWMFDFLRGFMQLADGRGHGLWDRIWELLHSIRIKESSTTWCEMSKVEWLAFCGEHS